MRILESESNIICFAERSKIEYEKICITELVSNMLFYLSEALPIALGSIFDA